MIESTSDETASLDIHDPEWPRRHGVAFDWTRAQHERFEKQYRLIRKRRIGGRRSIYELGTGILILTFLFACPFAIMRLVDLRDGSFEDPRDALVSGLLIGATATFAVLLAVAFASRSRRAVVSDPGWVLTTMSVGVDRGVLWLYRHETLTLFTSAKSFTAVERTKDLILAFINRTAAHAFPRDELGATVEGRRVLDWFEANWPDPSIGEVSDQRPSVFRRVRRGTISLLAILAWAVALTAVLLGAVALWRMGSIAHWRSPQALGRSSAAVAAPTEHHEDPEPVPVSGRSARDFLDRLKNPAGP